MDNARLNMDRFLNEKVMQEQLRGGPARYRQAHQGMDPHAEYRLELGESRKGMGHRALLLKLPWLPTLQLRLPGWARVGKLTA